MAPNFGRKGLYILSKNNIELRRWPATDPLAQISRRKRTKDFVKPLHIDDLSHHDASRSRTFRASRARFIKPRQWARKPCSRRLETGSPNLRHSSFSLSASVGGSNFGAAQEFVKSLKSSLQLGLPIELSRTRSFQF